MDEQEKNTSQSRPPGAGEALPPPPGSAGVPPAVPARQGAPAGLGWLALRRLALLPVEVLLVSLVVFTVLWVVPGDAGLLRAVGGEDVLADPEVAQLLRQKHGIDRPLPLQYAGWLAGSVAGTSWWTEEPVLAEISKRLPVTLELLAAALVGAASLIIVGGVAAALLARLEALPGLGAWVGGVRLLWLSGWLAAALPAFGLGTWFIVFPAIWWGYLPPLGYVEPWVDPGANLRQLLLPSLVLALGLGALTVHGLHAGAARVLAGGLGWGRAAAYLVLRAAALMPSQVGILLSLVIVVETVFALPGTGTLLLRALFLRDYPQLMGGAMFFAILVIGARFVGDLMLGLAEILAGGVAHAPAGKPVRARWVLAAVLGAALVIWPLVAVLAPALAPYDPVRQHFDHVMDPPGGSFLLGTDNFGRDLFSRVLHGVWAGTAMADLLADLVLLPARALTALPLLVAAMAVLAALGPGLLNVGLAVAFALVPLVAIVAGAELRHTLTLRPSMAMVGTRPAS